MSAPRSSSRRHPGQASGRRHSEGQASTYRLPPRWPEGPSDLTPRRAMSEMLRTDHMPAAIRLAHLGLLAVTLVTLVFLLPSFLIYLAGLQSIMQVSGVGAAILGLLALMFSFGLAVVQTALVLKVPERLEWVRFGLTALVLIAVVEAVARDWLYPSVMSMGFRWDLMVTAAMVLLLWLPTSNAWFTAPASRRTHRATLGAHLAA